ncbi:MAG: carbamoyltransferase HypF [Candidatus Thorarchaeota archaeon]
MKIQAQIHVNGIVQGVGFRPFVYRVAKKFSLLGYVLNLGDAGVSIVVEGRQESINELIKEIKSNPPSISTIDTLVVEWCDITNGFSDFTIEQSSMSKGEEAEPIIPPDIAICEDCVKELSDLESRWYHYPFTSCAACGPRYSTITSLPYDRPNTTMDEFPLCATCNAGYTNPLNRRYHAQITACKNCGPQYQLLDAQGSVKNNPIESAARLIEGNAILAIQGIGGTHLVTKTTEPTPIQELRRRKRRVLRPFAIMVRNESALNQFFAPTQEEITLLKSWKRPIVLVKKRKTSVLDVIPNESIDEIAPGLDTIGVMLPYSPLHHLLFQKLDEPALVFTSANPTGVPMYIDPRIIFSDLSGIADYFLVHNRRIHQRADDSVIKFVQKENPVFIRRARGYVPEPLQLVGVPKKLRALAVGPEEKATSSVLMSGRVYPTQHIGDTDRVENIQFLSNAFNHLMDLIGMTRLDAIASDLHPEFLSTELAQQVAAERNIPHYQVQHHHAHLASLLIDHKLALDTRIACITADGYGYGSDGAAWGGEVLVGNAESFTRVGGIRPTIFPGGDLSAKYAIRPLLGLLGKALDIQEVISIVGEIPIGPSIIATENSLGMLSSAINQEINTISSSSAGRFLDAVALALGICSTNTYDGECPMKLEAVSKETDIVIVPKYVSNGNMIQLDVTDSLLQIINLKRKGTPISQIAYAAQQHLGLALADIAIKAAEQNKVKHIGFSGGVALNTIITKAIVDRVKEVGLAPLIHRNVPPGDGGISIGQIGVAALKIQNGRL